jgi:hypothetical protein
MIHMTNGHAYQDEARKRFDDRETTEKKGDGEDVAEIASGERRSPIHNMIDLCTCRDKV